MALKVNIFHNVATSDVARILPSEFQGIVDHRQLQDTLYTVISYPGMRGGSTSIVDSKTLTKALPKAQSQNEPIIAVAHNFTSEAFDLLSQLNAICFFKSDYFWSDESFYRIRYK